VNWGWGVRIATAACALVLAACGNKPLASPNDLSSPTGGVGLTLWYAQVPTRQYQYFVLDASGKLSYAGGMPALNRKTEWSGPLTPEEGKQVRAIIDQAGWLSAESPARTDADTPLAEFRLESEGHSRSFEIRGPDESVQSLVNTLQKAADRRFEQFLQRLPDAGPQRR
jgi:hypothetical protein